MNRPLPISNAYTRPFWKAAAEGRLSLPRCQHCTRLHCPPAPRCPNCSSDALAWETLSGQGHLIGWTVVHLDTLPGVPSPFAPCAVELIEQAGLRLNALAAVVNEPLRALNTAVQITFGPPVTNEIAFPKVRLR